MTCHIISSLFNIKLIYQFYIIDLSYNQLILVILFVQW